MNIALMVLKRSVDQWTLLKKNKFSCFVVVAVSFFSFPHFRGYFSLKLSPWCRVVWRVNTLNSRFVKLHPASNTISWTRLTVVNAIWAIAMEDRGSDKFSPEYRTFPWFTHWPFHGLTRRIVHSSFCRKWSLFYARVLSVRNWFIFQVLKSGKETVKLVVG